MDAGALDFDLAWQRLKADRPKLAVVGRELSIRLIDEDRGAWFAAVRARVAAGWRPAPARLCAMTRKDGLFRPIGVLTLEDSLVYTALVSAIAPVLWTSLAEIQADVDLYPLSEDPAAVAWTSTPSGGHALWEQASAIRAPAGTQFVVVGDIARFYDRIPLPPLIERLLRIGCAPEHVEALRLGLQTWSEPRGVGLPQGHSASFVLSRLCLASVDRAIAKAGFEHVRAADEFRIFCNDRAAARRALTVLWRQLFDHGLDLSGSKVAILPPEEADKKIGKRGRLPRALHRVRMDRRLRRLGREGSEAAVEGLLDALRRRPADVSFVRKYAGRGLVTPTACSRVLARLGEDEGTFGYRIYEVLRALARRAQALEGPLLDLARRWVLDSERLPWIREACAELLAVHGLGSDADALVAAYASSADEATRVACAYAACRLGSDPAVLEVMDEDLLVARACRAGTREHEAPDAAVALGEAAS